MADKTTFPFTQNKNNCSSCGKKNLPEPIVFAQSSRLTSDYVCGKCYADHNYTIGLMLNAELMDDIAQGECS